METLSFIVTADLSEHPGVLEHHVSEASIVVAIDMLGRLKRCFQETLPTRQSCFADYIVRLSGKARR